MWLVIRLAFRNALRNRRRSLFTLLSLLLGVGLYIVAQAFVDGIERTLVSTEVDVEHAHLRVAPSDWMRDEDWFPLDIAYPEAPAVADMLRSEFPGAKVLVRTSFLAEIGDGRRKLACRGLVVPPDGYRDMFRLGDLPVPDGDDPFVWIGTDLAGAFGLKPGDTLFLKAKTRKGTLNALDGVRVAGLVASGHPLIDNFTVLVPERVGRDLLDVEPGLGTEVMARFQDPDDADRADAAITQRWPQLSAETWREKTAYLVDLNNVRRSHFNIVVGIILLIGAASVANTCLMSGFERTKEVGTLLAIGFGRGRVLAAFVVESLMIGIAGALAGATAGGAVAGWYTAHGLEIPGLSEQSQAVPMPPILWFQLTPTILAAGVGIGLVIAVLASLWPAWRSSRLDPLVALREEG